MYVAVMSMQSIRESSRVAPATTRTIRACAATVVHTMSGLRSNPGPRSPAMVVGQAYSYTEVIRYATPKTNRKRNCSDSRPGSCKVAKTTCTQTAHNHATSTTISTSGHHSCRPPTTKHHPPKPSTSRGVNTGTVYTRI